MWGREKQKDWGDPDFVIPVAILRAPAGIKAHPSVILMRLSSGCVFYFEFTFATKCKKASFILASSCENSIYAHFDNFGVALHAMLTQHCPQHHPSIIPPLTSCRSLLRHHPSTIPLPRAHSQQKKKTQRGAGTAQFED